MEEGSLPQQRTHHYQTKEVLTDEIQRAKDQRDANRRKSFEQEGGECSRVSSLDFYGEYHGHTIPHLRDVLQNLRNGQQGSSRRRRSIFLLGDSSFDNKYWFHNTAPAVNGYEFALGGSGRAKQDIAYWFNRQLVDIGMGSDYFCINGAVEESTLADRFDGKLLTHDVFVRENLGEEDVLVISAGGNDIALRPSVSTILSVAALLCQPMSLIRSGWAVGLGHFKTLFKTRVEGYIRSLCAKQTPKLVVVCMIYYLDEVPGGSWADGVLEKLGYNSNPQKLQLLIRTVFALATENISVDGVEVRAFPLFKVLDGKTTSDYEQRVEPSAQGGEKIGRALVDFIAKELKELQ